MKGKKIPTHPCLNCPHDKEAAFVGELLNMPSPKFNTLKDKSIFSMILSEEEYKSILKFLRDKNGEEANRC